MKKLILLFLSTTLLFSCGGNKKKEVDSETNKQVAEKGNFSVLIDGVYKKDDNIVLYYKQNGAECDDQHAIKQAVKGSDNVQTIVLKLPEDVVLENFRINLSNNTKQETVLLNSFKIVRNTKNFEIKQVEFTKYLNFNENVSWDDKLKGFKYSTLKNEYIPRVLGNQAFESKLSEL